MIVPTASDEGVGQELATVAKDEKILFTLKIGAKTIFGMPSLKIIISTNSDKGWGKYLATDAMK